MKSRLLITRQERAQLWDVVARHRATAGDRAGAAFARWQAKSIRSDFPLGVNRGRKTRNQ